MTVISSNAVRGAILWSTLAVLEAGAQVTLKFAAVETSGTGFNWHALAALLGSPWFLISVGCDGFAFLLWMVVLARYDLSLAVPVSACSYLTIILASSIVLLEPVTAYQIAGTGLIGVGIWFIVND